MPNNAIREFVFKIVVLGDAAVGKTSLINQYIESGFTEDYKPTLGANIIRKDVTIYKSIEEKNDPYAKVRLILWDLAGQDKYNSVRSMYFQGCVGALLVYDITRVDTFESVKVKWLRDFRQHVDKQGAYVLIGNKKDLENQRLTSVEQGQQLAQEINASNFIETSAKYNENVELAFVNLVHEILREQGEKI